MGYRGEDLDLRSPPAYGGQERQAAEFGGDAGRGPIYVDDVLMACCNHAYDVALAHRAGEVRIEHLLYALTRHDAAAEVLEANGIRDAGLRRESAAVIASDIPIGLGNGLVKPRRSKAFEEALRLAAEVGRRRNGVAGVADLITVFLEVEPGLPGLDLLRRHATQRSEFRAAAPANAYDAPAVSPSYDALFRDRERERERGRRAGPRGAGFVETYAEPREEPRRLRSVEANVDSLQNARLDALERMVRDLRDDLADERGALASVLDGLQRDVSLNREDHGRMSQGLVDRLSAFERTIMNARDGGGGMSGESLARIADMEERVVRRLDEIARQSHALTERIGEIEAFVTSGTSGEQEGSLVARLEAIERQIGAERVTGTRAFETVAERLKSLEGLVADQRLSGGPDLSPLDGRLSDIETAVLSLEAGGASGDLARRVAAAGEAVERLQAIMASERSLGMLGERLEGSIQVVLTSINQALGPMARMLGEVREFAGDGARRLDAMDASLARQAQETAEARETYARELGEVHEAIVKLNTNQHTLAGEIDRWRGDWVADTKLIGERLAQLDRDNDAPIARIELISERMDGLYRATVERYHRRNRFWFWLFGTDDWLGASWPSQIAKVEEELRDLKSARPLPAAKPPG
ncbi:MAG: Clp protease N-terminal domain-containing protein [Hyphomicrobiaceae bacterium]|nr:Clp protease N-terminal domain-containing protein [Hyphomicrobiaceae bacterium]